MTILHDLTRLPIFDQRYADCASCAFAPNCDKGRRVTSYRPDNFNGLMLVVDAPMQQEVVAGRPMVGSHSRLLRELLESADLNLDECYIMAAVLGKPVPPTQITKKAKSLVASFPGVVPACLSRVEAEIAAVRPRVILTLGATAWAAISGYDKPGVRHVPFDCEHCDENRRVGPVIQCGASVRNPADGGKTATPCHHLHYLTGASPAQIDPAEVERVRAAGCVQCHAKLSRTRPKMVKCPVCHGKKRRDEEFSTFTVRYSLASVAGGIFTPGAPDEPRQAHHLDVSYREFGVAYIVPTYHPKFLTDGQQFLAAASKLHVQKVRRLLAGVKPLPIEHVCTKDPDAVRAFHQAVLAERGTKPNYAIDIETEAGEGGDARQLQDVAKITCIGIGNSDRALVVDTREVDPRNPDDPLLAALFDFLCDSAIDKTYHHGAGYDLLVLDKVWGFPVAEQLPSYTDDTMFAHGNLYPDEPHTLAHVVFSTVDAFAWKPARTTRGTEMHETFEELAAYNARDVVLTSRARERMGVSGSQAIPGGPMDRDGLSRVYEQDCKIRRIAVAMTMGGMPLDMAQWKQAGTVAKSHIDHARGNITAALREAKIDNAETFNPSSTPQKIELLFGKNGFNLPILSTSDSGGASTDKPTLQKLLSVARDPLALTVLAGMIELLEHEYVAKNFVFSPKMQPWADGRIHPVWKPWGARTGRFSSAPNAQNWPKWLRRAIVAEKGFVFVGSDFDQIELRGMGLLTGDLGLIARCLSADENRKLEPEHDPHSYVASLAFALRYTRLNLQDPTHRKVVSANESKCVCQTCQRKALRDLTKRVIYGLNYGAGNNTVLASIYAGGYSGPPITLDMIEHIRRTVFKAFPGVETWRTNAVENALESGELRSPLYDRLRRFPLFDVPVPETYNFPIQSLGADIMNERLILVAEVLPTIDKKAHIMAQVHDAAYIHARKRAANEVQAMLDELLPCTKTINGVSMPFTATAGQSVNWADAA